MKNGLWSGIIQYDTRSIVASVTSVSNVFFVSRIYLDLKNIQLSCPCLRNVGLECHLQHSKTRISGIFFHALHWWENGRIRVVPKKYFLGSTIFGPYKVDFWKVDHSNNVHPSQRSFFTQKMEGKQMYHVRVEKYKSKPCCVRWYAGPIHSGRKLPKKSHFYYSLTFITWI